MSVRITVLLNEDVDARFTAFCEDKGFKKSTLTARLIREHLDRQGAGPPESKRKTKPTFAKKRGAHHGKGFRADAAGGRAGH